MESSQASVRVLVVDDDNDILSLLSTWLTDEGLDGHCQVNFLELLKPV